MIRQYMIRQYMIRQSFKVTIVSGALSSLLGESFESSLRISLNPKYMKLFFSGLISILLYLFNDFA